MNKINICIFLAVIGIIIAILPDLEFNSAIDDINMCSRKNATKNECNSFQIDDSRFQCCKLMAETNKDGTINKEESCSAMTNPINTAINEMNTENGKKIMKELIGFSMFKDKNPGNVNFTEKVNFTCNDGNLPFEFNIKDYSEAQKVEFNDSNYCLNYSSGIKVDKETCYNAKVTQSGISCGYFDLQLVLNNSNPMNFNTCFLFNDDIVKNKNIGFITKYLSDMTSLSEAKSLGKELLSYKLTFSRKDGKTVKYDSSTGEVKIEGEDNSGKMLGLKYMILIIALLI